MDTSLADATYYNRMIAVFSADSQPQRAAEYGARATRKFANDADLCTKRPEQRLQHVTNERVTIRQIAERMRTLVKRAQPCRCCIVVRRRGRLRRLLQK